MRRSVVSLHLKRHLAIAMGLLAAIAFVDSSAAAERANADPGTVEAVEMDPLGDPLFDDEFDAEFEGTSGFPDPLEPVNRRTLRFNQAFDSLLIAPVVRVYRFFVPGQARQAVRQVFANLNSPVILANDLLQREWGYSGVTATRFVLNSTLGVGGIFDPAQDFGYDPHKSDFGQTMALAGVGSGPFLVIPVLGPTTARDGFGFLVDIMFRPTTYLLAGTDQVIHAAVRGSSAGVVARDANAESMDALEESSVDFYAALKNAYYQHRTAEIWSRHERPDPGVETAALD